MLAGPNEIVDEFRAMVLATRPQGLAGCYAALRDADLRRTISLVRCPTLVIAGEHDTVTAASHSRAIAGSIPGAQLIVLPTVHLPNIERPAEFLQIVLEFLSRGSGI